MNKKAFPSKCNLLHKISNNVCLRKLHFLKIKIVFSPTVDIKMFIPLKFKIQL